MATLEETLRKLGLAAARGVPQLATGFVDLAALPFTMTGVMKPEQAVGSTAYLTSKGLLPPPQEGLLSETTELVSSAVNPATAVKSIGLLGATKVGKNIINDISKNEMKVFHGGASKVADPDLSRSGSVSGLAEEGEAFWVTPSKTSALGFGSLASKTPVISEFNFQPKNPLIVEYPVKSIIDGSFSKIKIDSLNKARKSGNDSVIFKQKENGLKLLDDEIAILNTKIVVASDKPKK